MESFFRIGTWSLGVAWLAGLSGLVAVACGSKDNDNVRTPADEPRAMKELTPSERESAERRAARENERDRQLAASREPAPGGVHAAEAKTTPALAVSSIAAARCDREMRCKNIGPNEKYLSKNECVTKLENEKRPDVNFSDCPRGVSDKDLSSCLQSIRDENCGNPLDAISRLNACRAGALCLK